MAALLPAALAAPSLHVRQDTQDVNVVVQYIKATSEQDIAVTNKDFSQVLGYSCSNTLDSGAFADVPISADLDFNGAGNLTIGSETYKVHENPDISGGITCSRMYNNAESLMTCAISLPSSLDLSPLSKRENDQSCFLAGATPSLQRAALSMLAGNTGPVQNLTSQEAHQMEKRVGSPGCKPPITETVGDGNPHQNYFDKQLSQNINCGAAPGCSIGQSNSISYTLGWNAGAIIDEWITGGFDVSVSWTTGNVQTCDGSSGETVCLWYNTAFTAYTVQNYKVNNCNQNFSPSGDPTILWSPNTNNAGGGAYYCVVGTCRSQGQGYWDYNGRAGGP
ncbi:hypothetical protein L228DRAFT_271675 [Xylona heveae TC161]|uniref:Uncharacterized protein n=1 Tax=Xylona heveae (strain CBS 132557 / TC161) TaxID=1328760 RepID=A0A164ZFT8_XYLHT|nr:hypothetical protein L228DRAFT_271675 [Xylona heveae TC161]KZF19049.1 hypothetical protein L228DRAFT_271675 [Xylona heveae TC161]